MVKFSKFCSESLHGGPCRQRAGEFHESNVCELIVNCAIRCFLRAPQARGVTGLRPGKPLVTDRDIAERVCLCNCDAIVSITYTVGGVN